MTRRTFLGATMTGSVAVAAGGLRGLMAAETTAKSNFSIGGDLLVNRLGYGAMRLTGEGIWGWPADRENAKKVLGRPPGAHLTKWFAAGGSTYMRKSMENCQRELRGKGIVLSSFPLRPIQPVLD